MFISPHFFFCCVLTLLCDRYIEFLGGKHYFLLWKGESYYLHFSCFFLLYYWSSNRLGLMLKMPLISQRAYIFSLHISYSFCHLRITCCNVNCISLPLQFFRKPNKRVEVAQLNDVMDTMLERAGVENQEYTGPTKVIAKLNATWWLRACTQEADCLG